MNLKKLRNEKKWSQQEIAEKLNMNYRVYGTYERGERELPLNLAIKLADLYNVSLDYLVGRERKEEE